MRLSRKRLLMAAGGITAVGAAATLVAGVTFGLFSATSPNPQANTFAAGTVALVTLGQPASTSCTVGPMAPGDQSTGFPTNNQQTSPKTAPCTFAVDYTGTLPAYIGVSLITTGTGLYDGTTSGLQFQISGGTTSYTTAGQIHANTTTSPLYVTTDPASSPTAPTLHTFTVDYGLPQLTGNTYQGLNTTLTITVYAVQASNNNTATGCTAGAQCSAITWS
jgi:hypothetical protein